MAKALRFDGAFTALITPFREGSLDLDAVDRLVDAQIQGGITGIVPCGTTGESPVLDADESRALIARVIARAQGRTQVIAGTGSNDTRHAIKATQAAQALGVDAAMIVMPYYNRPTQSGLIAHVRAIHDATDLPLVLYNVPSRTASDLSVESLVEITHHCPRVVAVKEATGNVVRTQAIVAALGDRVAVLSGDDALTLGILACGGRGVISVTSNIAPAKVQSVVDLFHRGELSRARSEHLALLPLHETMFVESNPGPVKAAAHLLGLSPAEIRLPLVWPTDASVEKVRAALQQQGLLR
ncbi:MAG: 4-hydroxy-tetrahydrodipicolinate synthase [Deltaproteobacteria bacterium]|nr:4-hydroxy-tetrahydrodipicolinate synthase [Deltaproteobacteria bacterium]